MDKFKKILTILKKYYFWVTCVVILLVGIVCWWTATAGLASQFTKRKSTLEGQFSSVQKIQRNDPNDKVIEAIHDQETKLKEEVWNAWEILYNEQKEKNPIPKVLGDEFREQFENLKPNGELPRQYREHYQNFIERYLPKLKEVVNIRRLLEVETPDGDRPKDAAAPAGRTRRAPGVMGGEMGGRMPGAGMGGNAETEMEWTGIVDWNQNDIQALESRFQWDATPSTLAVVLAQEDLWVIGALLRVIAQTNEGANGPALAAVKQITALLIGRDAVSSQNEASGPIFSPSVGTDSAGGMMGPGAGMMGPGAGMMGPGAGMMGARPGMTEAGPGMMGPGGAGGSGRVMEGRYVDDKGMPLTATSEYPYAEHPYAEFKMMPVRMNLVMDQRRLPKLLVECANSNMPIEVRSVRILKSQGGATETRVRAPAMMGGNLMGGFPGMGGGAAAQTVDGASETGPHDVPIEIYGLIYIYNPPDRAKLGTGAASLEKPADGAAPGEPGALPAETPATPPVPAGASNPYRKWGAEA